MRKGEALGLQWSAVNFTKGTISINKQLQKVLGQKEYRLISPKTEKAVESLPHHSL